MSDDAPPKKQESTGSPAWVMTFADLMSLLMCFFVLLLSFSEMDVSKYKQLAGSMANAFGVQRDIKVKEPPKGINIIAREFSPGRPEPTPLNVVKQQTTADLRIHLDVGGQKRHTPSPRSNRFDPKDAATMKPEKPAERMADRDVEQKKGQQADDESGAKSGESADVLPGKQLKQEGEGKESGSPDTRLDDATAQEILDAREAQERREKLEANAKKISAELRDQIQDGAVDVEQEGRKIVIRIREKASFGSGTAEVIAKFRPVLWRLGEILEGTEGRIIVAGHTDNVPIHTRRYRSNWELSSARAVSVVHELLWQTAIPLDRFLVQGHAETQPIAPNETAADRAKNRRVEIILMQGEDKEAQQEITQKGITDKPEANPVQQSASAGPLDKGVAAPVAADKIDGKAGKDTGMVSGPGAKTGTAGAATVQKPAGTASVVPAVPAAREAQAVVVKPEAAVKGGTPEDAGVSASVPSLKESGVSASAGTMKRPAATAAAGESGVNAATGARPAVKASVGAEAQAAGAEPKQGQEGAAP